MPNEEALPESDALERLRELVLDYLGIPRPGRAERQRLLEDDLLPFFKDAARQAWLLADPPRGNLNCVWDNLRNDAESCSGKATTLRDILEEEQTLALLRALASSPDVRALARIRPDPYENRLLKAAGHPNADREFALMLWKVAEDPSLLAEPSQTILAAGEATLTVHSEIFPTPGRSPEKSRGAGPASTATPAVPEKAKKRKLFTGLGKVFSGLMLLTGNGIVAYAVPLAPLATIPVIGSLAGGLAQVSEGVGALRREGE